MRWVKCLALVVLFTAAAVAQPAPAPATGGDDCKISFSQTCSFRLGSLSQGEIEADDLKIEFNSPTVPAGAIIGDDDLALTTVRTFSDLTPQLLAGFNDNMELQPGLAIGGAPYWWFEPEETLDDYRRKGDWAARIAKRTQFGLATKQEAAEDAGASNRLLVGVSLGWQLLDDQDVRSAKFAGAASCITQQLQIALQTENRAVSEKNARIAEKVFINDRALFNRAAGDIRYDVSRVNADWFRSPEGRAVFDRMTQENDELNILVDRLFEEFPEDEWTTLLAAPEGEVKAFKEAQEACNGRFTKQLASSQSLMLNIATGMASGTGKVDNLAAERSSVWLTWNSGTVDKDRLGDPSYRKPLNVFGAPVVGFLNYNFNEKLTLPNDTEVEADRLIVGVGTSFKNGEEEAFDFQASFIRTEFDTSIPRSNDYRVTASYSKKMSDFIWLEAKVGTTNSDELEDATFAGINLKVDWAALWRSRQ
jgi:hypothetical protein